MGYYADSTWNITVTGDIDALASEIKSLGYADGWTLFISASPTVDDRDSVGVLRDAVTNCNEDSNVEFSDDGRSFSGWGGGKMLSQASDDDFWATLAKYCTGTVDWRGEDNSLWRVRLYGNGEFKDLPGIIVYPDDTEAFTP